MNLPPNAFLRAIRAGEKQIGLWVSLCDAFAADIIAGAGFDWVVLDMEHAPNELTTVMNQMRAFQGSGTTTLVRPDWNDAVKVKRLLDAGAPGLIFPMVQNVAEATAAIRATRYPPNGIRGVSGNTRANNFGRMGDYFARIEEETVVIMQAETQAAMAQVAAIADVPGVDGVFFGPADIAADMGLLGQPMHADVWAAIRHAAKPLMDKGVPVGTLVSDAAFAKKLLDDGFTFVACGMDAGLLARAADSLIATMRAN